MHSRPLPLGMEIAIFMPLYTIFPIEHISFSIVVAALFAYRRVGLLLKQISLLGEKLNLFGISVFSLFSSGGMLGNSNST